MKTTGIALLLLFALQMTATAVSAEFGRLFTDPGERTELDKIRFAKKQPVRKPLVLSSEPVVEEPQADVVLRGFRYDGMVRRSRGPSTAWVDGRPVLTGAKDPQGIGLELSRSRPGELQLRLPRGAGDLSLKPGEIFEPGPSGIPYTGEQADGAP